MVDKTNNIKEDFIKKALEAKEKLDVTFFKYMEFIKRKKASNLEISTILDENDNFYSEFITIRDSIFSALEIQKEQNIKKDLYTIYCEQRGGDCLKKYIKPSNEEKKGYYGHDYTFYDYGSCVYIGLDGLQDYFIQKKNIKLHVSDRDKIKLDNNESVSIKRIELKISRYYAELSFKQKQGGIVDTTQCEEKLEIGNKKEAPEIYNDIVNNFIEEIINTIQGVIYCNRNKTRFYCPETKKYIAINFNTDNNFDDVFVAVTTPYKTGKTMKIKFDRHNKSEVPFKWESKRVKQITIEDMIEFIKNFTNKFYIKHFMYKEKNK